MSQNPVNGRCLEGDVYDFAIVGSGYGGCISALRLTEAGFSVILVEQGCHWEPKHFKQSYSPHYLNKLYYDSTYTNDFSAFFRTAKVLGGGSILNAGASLEAPAEAFQTRLGDRLLWPPSVTKATLTPFYETVRKKLGIKVIPEADVSKSGRKFAEICHRAGLNSQKVAFNFQDCLQYGFCQAGCKFGRKVTAWDAYGQPAQANGAKILIGAKVVEIGKNKDRFRIAVRSKWRTQTIQSQRVILAAGTIGNVRILENSRRFLPTLSNRVGEQFTASGSLTFFFELSEADPDYFCFMGQTNPGIYCFNYWSRHRMVLHAVAVPHALMGALVTNGQEGSMWDTSGRTFAGQLETLFPHKIVGGALHGIPQAVGRLVKVNRNWTHPQTIFDRSSTLILATCSMADNIDHGVVNPDGEVFGCPGLYINDGSVIPSSLGVNPYLTIAANAE
ncbi:MAG: GMC family oxidoreductase N-terminal domain-containing protein [Acidobacteriota bacterium]